MEEGDVIKICVDVLNSLDKMGYEKDNVASGGQLIFPMKKEAEDKQVDRISEQELRQLFIEKFKTSHTDLYYSIETPTKAKYSFGKEYDEIDINENGQSALLDMCVFKENEKNSKYNRILNIEFKHQNAALKNIAKDVLKLMHEEQKGAFIFLLKNTDSGTLCNNAKTGVLDKLSKSFFRFKHKWEGDKSIELIIISLNQKTLIHSKITDKNLDDLKSVFSVGNIKITDVSEESEWGKYTIINEVVE